MWDDEIVCKQQRMKMVWCEMMWLFYLLTSKGENGLMWDVIIWFINIKVWKWFDVRCDIWFIHSKGWKWLDVRWCDYFIYTQQRVKMVWCEMWLFDLYTAKGENGLMWDVIIWFIHSKGWKWWDVRCDYLIYTQQRVKMVWCEMWLFDLYTAKGENGLMWDVIIWFIHSKGWKWFDVRCDYLIYTQQRVKMVWCEMWLFDLYTAKGGNGLMWDVIIWFILSKGWKWCDVRCDYLIYTQQRVKMVWCEMWLFDLYSAKGENGLMWDVIIWFIHNKGWKWFDVRCDYLIYTQQRVKIVWCEMWLFDLYTAKGGNGLMWDVIILFIHNKGWKWFDVRCDYLIYTQQRVKMVWCEMWLFDLYTAKGGNGLMWDVIIWFIHSKGWKWFDVRWCYCVKLQATGRFRCWQSQFQRRQTWQKMWLTNFLNNRSSFSTWRWDF